MFRKVFIYRLPGTEGTEGEVNIYPLKDILKLKRREFTEVGKQFPRLVVALNNLEKRGEGSGTQTHPPGTCLVVASAGFFDLSGTKLYPTLIG